MAPAPPVKKEGGKNATPAKKEGGKNAPPVKKEGGKKKPPRIDQYFGSRDVIGLTANSIAEFLTEKDVALVFFYDPRDPQCDWCKKHFLKAAKTTVRENHAYAAVDCVVQTELCKTEGVTAVPLFKLYSKGKMFAEYNKPKEFIYHTMKKYVEQAPILEELGRPPRPC